MPIALARHVAARITDSELHVPEGVGHAAGHVARHEVLRVVAAHAQSA